MSIGLKGISKKERKFFGCHDLDPMTLVLKLDLDILTYQI